MLRGFLNVVGDEQNGLLLALLDADESARIFIRVMKSSAPKGSSM